MRGVHHLFRAMIVEDEKPILDLMKYIIGQDEHYTIVGAFTNPHEALAVLEELQVDVAFLDVEMPRMNGLELARRINEQSSHTKVVFTTAYKDYALDAFDVHAFHYLLKPVAPMAIEKVTKRLVEELGMSEKDSKSGNKMSIQCFGGWEVRNPAGEIIRWRTKKTEELFAYLLCHPGRDISKWQLMDVLWGEMNEDRATNNLHTTVYRLKKILKEQELGMDIIKTGEGYMLERRDHSYDVWAFIQHYTAATKDPLPTDLAEKLCQMYQGPLLDGKDYFWKTALEERFTKQYTRLVQYLVEQDLTNRDWQRAEERVDAFLAIYPLNEEMNQVLLQIYANNRQTGKIVKHYEHFAAVYRREYGVEPVTDIGEWVSDYLRKIQ